jgi:hypothetical protein
MLRKENSMRRKEFEQACKMDKSDKTTKLLKYVETQKKVREEIEEEVKKQTLNNINKIVSEGGVKSRNFWQQRKKILGKKTNANYNTITEEGQKLEDPEESREHIANFYENLYCAREGKPEYQVWTNKIKTEVMKIKQIAGKLKEDHFNKREINKAIRALKPRKSTGPDNIPNEVFIEASKQTKETYRNIFNSILDSNNIPHQWQKGKIIRLYKGKGTKGKCSNERGITLASNTGKLFERLVNNRVTDRIDITDTQAGGRKGRATDDHIMTMKQLIQINKNNNKPTYIAFLDVTKAYDKAWLDAIMYVMYKEGIKTNLWNTIKNLNTNLTARVATKYGLTRDINITDSIRQGGVLSVIQYALLMDEISKEIAKQNLGTPIPNSQVRVGCILWMDDVLLITPCPKDLQKMLDIVSELAGRYHIEYGEAKSKIMKIGKKGDKPNFKLGPMTLQYTDKYKYLGQVNNGKNNADHHIEETKGKSEAAFQTSQMIAGNSNFNGIEMEAFWEMIETCVIPIITYSGTTWNLNKKQTKDINQILDTILKRTLMVPPTTPREVIYMETGFMDIQTLNKRNRIGMEERIKRNPNKLTDLVTKQEITNGWTDQNMKIREEMRISDEDTQGKRTKVKKTITQRTKIYFKHKIEEDGKEKSKVNFLKQGLQTWTPGKRPAYMNKMNRQQVSTLFKARTRMLEVKNNYRGMYPNNVCRMCNLQEETQEHILETCTSIHKDNTLRTTKEDTFQDNIDNLIETVARIQKTMEIVNKQK